MRWADDVTRNWMRLGVSSVLRWRIQSIHAGRQDRDPTSSRPIVRRNFDDMQCNCMSLESITAAVRCIEQHTGFIDVLLNNVGMPVPPPYASTESTASISALQSNLLRECDKYSEVLNTNTASVIATTAAFLTLLHKGNRRRGWPATKLRKTDYNVRSRQQVPDVDDEDLRTSQIIIVSSTSGIDRSGSTGLTYGASKAATIHLGDSKSVQSWSTSHSCRLSAT